MSRHPDFHELVGNDLEPGERERLERVHDMLIAAGPPPELPQELAEPPRQEGKLVELARSRLRTGLVLAAAIVLAAFAAGYLLGARGEDSSSDSFTAAKTAVLGKSPDRLAVVRIGQTDDDGNRPMVVSVDGLDRLSDGDYYTLFMTRKGQADRDLRNLQRQRERRHDGASQRRVRPRPLRRADAREVQRASSTRTRPCLRAKLT